jgi:hypothetical protein
MNAKRLTFFSLLAATVLGMPALVHHGTFVSYDSANPILANGDSVCGLGGGREAGNCK